MNTCSTEHADLRAEVTCQFRDKTEDK